MTAVTSVRPLGACVVLAAGRSSRMGGPKALLVWEPGVPLAIAHANARRDDCSIVVLVVRADVAAALGPFPAHGKVVICLESERLGPAAGIVAAARSGALAGCERILLTPVDIPPPPTSTVTALFRALDANVLASRPRVRGQRGQPFACHARVIEQFAQGADLSALGGIIDAFKNQCADVDLDDPDALLDLNTPELFYERTGRMPTFWP